ncbi:MAG: flagellar motor switch protein FliG [Gammaproteobacteria bacterium]|nr:flagellar motor switch protein FliG [Gammaproteobacteria bacterium]
MAEKQQDLSGSERAAIFLMSLSEKEAAEVMKHMPVSEVQRLGKAMASLRKVSRSQADQVLSQFTNNVEGDAPLVGRSPTFLKRLLTSSLGEEKASKVLDRIVEGEPKGLDSLQLMEAKEITEVIHREHPQVIAVVLAGLDAKKAAEVVSQLPVRLSTEVVTRIARMGEIPQNTIEELDEVMQQRFSQSSGFKVTAMGGVRSAAEILNMVEKEIENQIIENLNTENAPLAQEIQENMFVFDNLLAVDDRGIQALVREVSTDVLVIALKGADQALQDKIFKNMSKRAGEMLKSDLEAKGPVRIAEVEAAQKEIVTVARRLADEGTIMLGGGGDDFV